MYPYLNPQVQTDLPQPDANSHLLLNHQTGRYVRMGLREYGWLIQLNGQIPMAEVAATFGCEPSLASEFLRRLAAANLIAFSDDPVAIVRRSTPDPEAAAPKTRRVTWLHPWQVRIHLWSPQALLTRFRSAVLLLTSRQSVGMGLLLVALALYVGWVQRGLLGQIRATWQWHWWQVLPFIGLIFLTTVLHELGHALACARFGAGVRSIGVMLFYLQPAAYADVTDAWRLADRWQRALIAAAGIYVQAVIGAVFLLIWSALAAFGYRADLLALFALLNVSVCVANCMPFVKLDGYWLLSHVMNMTNLRDKAVEWVRVATLAAFTRKPIQPQALQFSMLLTLSPLDRGLLYFFGLSALGFGLMFWCEGLYLVVLLGRWLGLQSGWSLTAAVGLTFGVLARSYIRGRRTKPELPPNLATGVGSHV